MQVRRAAAAIVLNKVTLEDLVREPQDAVHGAALRILGDRDPAFDAREPGVHAGVPVHRLLRPGVADRILAAADRRERGIDGGATSVAIR